jgi:hypothetical protein
MRWFGGEPLGDLIATLLPSGAVLIAISLLFALNKGFFPDQDPKQLTGAYRQHAEVISGHSKKAKDSNAPVARANDSNGQRWTARPGVRLIFTAVVCVLALFIIALGRFAIADQYNDGQIGSRDHGLTFSVWFVYGGQNEERHADITVYGAGGARAFQSLEAGEWHEFRDAWRQALVDPRYSASSAFLDRLRHRPAVAIISKPKLQIVATDGSRCVFYDVAPTDVARIGRAIQQVDDDLNDEHTAEPVSPGWQGVWRVTVLLVQRLLGLEKVTPASPHDPCPPVLAVQ